MAIKHRPKTHTKSKSKRKRLDAEDKVLQMEKKAAKQQKKLEYSAKLQETRKRREAVRAAGTVSMEDVVKAIGAKSTTKSSSSSKAIGDMSSLLSSIGIGAGVDNFAWSSESEPSDSEDESEYSEDSDADQEVMSEGEDSGDDVDEEDDLLEEDEDGEDMDECSEEESGSEAEAESVDLHKRVSFPSDTTFTPLSQDFLASLMTGDDVVLCSQTFHASEVARSCYLTLSAYLLSHLLHKSDVVERNNRKMRKKKDVVVIEENSQFRDQGPNRGRICFIAPFRANAYELIRNLVALLDIPAEEVGNMENFHKEYEGQDERNTHAKNWEPWRRELFKGHYGDANYDDFVIGLSITHGKVRIQFPKTAAALCGVDVIIASPMSLSRIAAADRRAIRVRDKQVVAKDDVDDEEVGGRGVRGVEDGEEEGEDLPIMDFLSSIELLVVDRVDALMAQNAGNCCDVVRAVNQSAVATITADINRIESKFFSSESAKNARQTVLVCGSTRLMDEQMSELSCLREGKCQQVPPSEQLVGTSLNAALKQKIKQQFFIRVPVNSPADRSEMLLEYFKTKFWKEVGNDIKQLVIVVADTADLAKIQEFLDDEGIVDCFLSESHLSEIAGKRRKEVKAMLRAFREGEIRTIVTTERLLWYQRIRISGARHVFFYGCPVTESVYGDVLADIADASRCTATCIYTGNERLALERVVGSMNIEKLVVADVELCEMPGKTTVFTPS